MICAHCNQQSDTASRVCPFCGRYMGAEPPEPLQVGEAVPVTYQEDYYRPGLPRGGRKQQAKRGKRRAAAKHGGRRAYRRVMINWAMVTLIAGVLVVASVLAGFVYLKVTPAGQLVLARMGRDASADAYWALGMEYLDQGYISRSIQAYEHAYELEPEHPDLVNNLLKLGEAYETGGYPWKAEEVYTHIYEKLKPDDPVGYRNAIRIIMQQEDRINEAVTLMELAASNTKDQSFAKQRASLVPLPPTARESSGQYLKNVTVEFISPQGYDIYYTTGDGPLPDSGILYTEPFIVGEGVHTYRAAAMASQLMSDEMEVKYVVTLPKPPAPKSNLAPGTYSGVRTVRLRDMETDKKDPRKQTQMYFTLDDTPPNADSPQFTGDPIRLPGGRVNLRAIAINGYGKVSNELNVQYVIRGVPFKDYFNGKDEFRSFKLMKTSYEQFIQQYGEPQSVENIEDDAINVPCVRGLWQWGEARFATLDIGQMLYHISTDQAQMVGPRGTKVGMPLEQVIQQFRDMGQPPNARGDRGLYYNIADGYARYQAESDDPDTGTLHYIATLYDVATDTQNTRLLDYDIQGGEVKRITFRYVNRKISIVL